MLITKPKITLAVITVNYNKSKSTLDLMKSLEKSNFMDFKFIVVDNNSDEEDINNLETEMFTSPLATKLIYRKSNDGWGMALNDGFKYILEQKIPLALVINNDTRVFPDTIEQLLQTMETMWDVGICGCKILNADGDTATAGGKIDWLTRLTGITRENKARWKETETVSLNDNEFVDDCAWIIRSSIMSKVQYPKELFLYFEELWIVEAARKLRYKLAYNPKARIVHA